MNRGTKCDRSKRGVELLDVDHDLHIRAAVPTGDTSLHGEQATWRSSQTRRSFTADAELLEDLDRIEYWPRSVEERRREERNRLWNTTVADAHNDHYLGMPITEPYGSWLDEIDARREARDGRVDDAHSSELEFEDVHAQRRLVDAAAWASAVRTE